jgi:hypothetical protein
MDLSKGKSQVSVPFGDGGNPSPSGEEKFLIVAKRLVIPASEPESRKWSYQ